MAHCEQFASFFAKKKKVDHVQLDLDSRKDTPEGRDHSKYFSWDSEVSNSLVDLKDVGKTCGEG